MRSRPRRLQLITVAVAALVVLAAVAGCGKASAPGGTSTTSAVARSRTATGASTTVTGTTSSAGSGTAAATATATATAGFPSRRTQINVLDGALKRFSSLYRSTYDTSTPGPEDIADYDVGALWRQGIDGAGTTVALLEGWNDPGIGAYMARIDSYYHLPAAQISTIYPAGRLPARCPRGMVILGSYGSCSAWAGELQLDVTSVHMMAPYARILLVATPADTETTEDAAQNVAPPEMLKGVEAISRGHLANVISVSDGTGEGSFSHGRADILAQNPGELSAAATGIPFVAGTGDCGVVAQLPRHGQTCQHTTSTAQSGVWDDSPWVTAVGGSVPDLSRTGARLGPDHLWRARAPYENVSAAAGLSSVFARPGYQDDVASITHSRMRSVPDITMDASDGTSEATPLFAGILALATQANGGADLGPINPALYAIGPHGSADGIEDVVGGDNSRVDPHTGKVLVPGDTAADGFDIASGWGTVDAARLVPSLVAETRKLGEERAARNQAGVALSALAGAIHAKVLAGRAANGDERVHVTATGLLPEFPVGLNVSGELATTARVDAAGDLATTIELSRHDLEAGTGRLTLTSLLITQSARITGP